MDKKQCIEEIKKVLHYQDDENASDDYNKGWDEACKQILHNLKEYR